jgi:hypothetical protein
MGKLLIDENYFYEWDDPRTDSRKGTVGDLDVVGKLELAPHDDGSQLLTLYCLDSREFICTGKESDFKQLMKSIGQAIAVFRVK